jgi:TRAP-type C4-dicarboxylate transport system permease large subunit
VAVIFEFTQDRTLILILVNVLLFIVGMVVNDITAIILVAPLLLPLMKAIGVDPVHFAAIIGVNTALGGITPPYASILYMGARIGNVKVVEIVPPAMKLLLYAFLPAVLLTAFWPDLALFFPRVFGY